MESSRDAADGTTLETAVVADLGYLHKKFKKVAATFVNALAPVAPPAAQHPPVQCPELLPPPPLPVTPPPAPPPPVLPALLEQHQQHHLPLTPPPKPTSIHPVLKEDKNADADGHPVRNKGKHRPIRSH